VSSGSIFFEPRVSLNRSEVLGMVRDGLVGFFLALALGIAASLIAKEVKGLDPLVAAVVLGMAASVVVGAREKVYFKVLPGIILAQSIFIPIGVALYGKNLEIKVMLASSPWVFLQVAGIAAITFVFMYWLGKLFGFNERMRYLLGFGSAICGASAIAIASPVLEGEPNDTAAGLVDNTIAALISMYVLATFVLPHVLPREYAAVAGTLLHQTGFVKMALASEAKNILEFGVVVKSLRVVLLVVAIPAVSYLIRKRIYVPWYLVLFLVVAVVFSYVPLGAHIATGVTTIYEICFSAALVSIGMNANLLHVFKRLLKPLVLIMLVFALDLALWWFTHRLIHY
jgi:uncharacterized integral membrane protein (TIGR00698 family)